MSSVLHQALAASPLADLPPWQQAVALVVVAPVVVVVLNVASQLLLPANKSNPPVVFHYVPVVGSAVSYGMDPITFFRKCKEQYGDVFTFVLLGRRVTVALGSKGSNLVLNGKLSQVSAEDAYTHLTTPVFGKEVVYDVPNAVLMEQKRFVKVGLSTDNLRAYVPQIVDETRTFVESDKQFEGLRQGKESSIDIFKVMSEITILTASRTLQGKEVRENLDKSFADLYHDLDAGFTPLNFVIPNLPLPNNFKRDRAQKKMSDFYKGIIAKRRATGDTNENDMIAALMSQTYKDGRPLSDTEIAHMMIALLMAGQHTSSATGSWAILRLASRPELIEELYDEQVRVYGDGHGGFRPLDYETQKTSVPIMDAVVKETLRLHPPIHSIMRKVKSPIPVPQSYAAPAGARKDDNRAYVIPEGHYVLAAPIYSQHDPSVWKQADVFNPHRWFDKDGVVSLDSADDGEKVDFGWGVVSSGSNSPYLPFGAGRHRCIGEQFAYLQLGTIVATLVRSYRWRLEKKFPDPDFNSMIVLPKAPRNVVFSKRA